MIKANAHKYSISALYRCLGNTRSTYYYECTSRSDDYDLAEAVQLTYGENHRVYGQMKIKRVLLHKGLIASGRKIGRIMKRRELVSAYTHNKYRVHAVKVNEAPVANLLDRDFSHRIPGACVISDLTYVRVGGQWVYICIRLDLGAREIIGYSAGAHKTAELVHDAFASVKGNLFEIQIFHTDHGREVDHMLMDEILECFRIQRSLSMKGCPYDDAVAESTFKMIKAEFAADRRFETLEQLKLELVDNVYWFNHTQLHSTRGYRSPVEFRNTYTL